MKKTLFSRLVMLIITAATFAGVVCGGEIGVASEIVAPYTAPVDHIRELAAYKNSDGKAIKPPVQFETYSETFYDIPLSEELQRYIIKVSNAYGIDPVIVFAIIRAESGYDPDTVGDNGNSVGLMQIQERWHWPRMERLEAYDLSDPYDNVTVGVDIIAEKIHKDRGVAWALMAYNGGHQYANNMISEGLISDYADRVMSYADEISSHRFVRETQIVVKSNNL